MSFLYFLQSIRCPALDAIFSIITHGGEETIFMAVGMIVFWCVNKYQGYYLLCVGFVGTVLNQFLKMLCRVPRPWIKDPNFPIVEAARAEATGYSFPSGHTQTSVGLFGGIARMTKNTIVRIVTIVLAVLIPFSRMYLGVHTPADVMTSVAIALALIFLIYPLFAKADPSPRVMYAILGGFLVLVSLYLAFVFLFPFPTEVYAADAVQNLHSAQKNGATLFGCAIGLLLAYTVDRKWIHFDTHAVWWAQIIKAVGGLAVVIAAKELLRAPLEAIFGNELVARGVRYFLIVVVGGILWPMSFRFFAKLGKNPRQAQRMNALDRNERGKRSRLPPLLTRHTSNRIAHILNRHSARNERAISQNREHRPCRTQTTIFIPFSPDKWAQAPRRCVYKSQKFLRNGHCSPSLASPSASA